MTSTSGPEGDSRGRPVQARWESWGSGPTPQPPRRTVVTGLTRVKDDPTLSRDRTTVETTCRLAHGPRPSLGSLVLVREGYDIPVSRRARGLSRPYGSRGSTPTRRRRHRSSHRGGVGEPSRTPRVTLVDKSRDRPRRLTRRDRCGRGDVTTSTVGVSSMRSS